MYYRCVMALIRGVKCWFPCPRCLIPEAKQGDSLEDAPPRTAAGTMATIQKAREQELAGDREDILKAAGLRNVDVHFRIYYLYFPLPLTTLSIECILEDQ